MVTMALAFLERWKGRGNRTGPWTSCKSQQFQIFSSGMYFGNADLTGNTHKEHEVRQRT